MFILLPGHFGEEFAVDEKSARSDSAKIAIDASILFLRRDARARI